MSFSTSPTGDVASKNFAADVQQWPPGSGSAVNEVAPTSLALWDGTLNQRVTAANPLPITGAQLASILTQLTAGTTAVAKAIGAAAGATDVGIPPLAMRTDTLATLSDPVGDYVPLRSNSQGALHVAGTFSATPASTGSTPTTVSVTTSSTTILAANGLRRKMILINEGNADVFLRYSATASITNYNEILRPGDRLEMDNVTSVVNGVVTTGTCSVRPTEFTV